MSSVFKGGKNTDTDVAKSLEVESPKGHEKG